MVITHTKKLFEPFLVQRVFHLITSLMDTAFAKNMAQPVRKTGYACSFSASESPSVGLSDAVPHDDDFLGAFAVRHFRMEDVHLLDELADDF